MYSEFADEVRASFHESHQIENVWLDVGWDEGSYHDPSWKCVVCEFACCQWGDVGDMADLREPCLGMPWYDVPEDE
jgi:hypothetical protein